MQDWSCDWVTGVWSQKVSVDELEVDLWDYASKNQFVLLYGIERHVPFVLNIACVNFVTLQKYWNLVL